MSNIVKFILLILLPFLLGARHTRPYSEYRNMSDEEKYEDLSLRFMLGDYTSFGDPEVQTANIKHEITSLIAKVDGDKKKVLDLFLIDFLLGDRNYTQAEKRLEVFSGEESSYIKSKYYYLKGRISYLKNDLDGAITLYKKGLAVAKGIEKYLLINTISVAEIMRGNNDDANRYVEQGLEAVKGYKPAIARLTLLSGIAYRNNGDMALALDKLFKASDIFAELGDNFGIVETLLHTALAKNSLGKKDEGILYYKKSEKYFSEDVPSELKALVLGNIFTSYLEKKDYVNSDLYYKKALAISLKHNHYSNIVYLKSKLANELTNRNNPKKAIEILNSLQPIKKEYWDNFDKFKYQAYYSRAYLRLGKYIEAEKFFIKAESLVESVGRTDITSSHFEDGVELYKILGNLKKEYEYYKKWRELTEKVEKEKSKKLLYARENESLALNNQLYAQENKNLALKNQQAELILENQKTRLLMLSGFVIAILVIVALQFNRNKIIKRKNLALEEKERVIREKTNDLQAILDNIVQGVVTIELVDEGVRRLKDVSRHFYDIFANINPNNFKDKDPIKVLFEGTSLSTEDLSKINSVIVSSTGETIWQWEINQSNLPMEMTILDGSKIIEIDWVVVVDQDVISKLIITFKDVTEIRGLGEKQRQNEINVQKLISLSLMDQKEYFILMSSVEKLINENIEIVDQNSKFIKENIDLVFRNLHTIKGLARTYDLMLLSAFAHQIEDYFQEVRSKKIDYDQAGCLAHLEDMKNEIETYRTLAKTKLKWDQELSTVPLSVKVLTKWYQEISGVNEGHKLDVLLKEIKNKYSTSLEDALQNIILSSKKLSNELNKGEVSFSLNGCDIFVTEKMEGHLSSIFVHLIRNSIDHGFLEISEREQQNIDLPEIKISVESGADCHVIYFSDNGRGINLETLQQKALAYNIKVDTSDELEVASLIFESGISTKEEVSNISGRGVGMDAVRKYLEGLGGHIDIVSSGESIGGYLPVKFKVTVPLVFFEM